MPALCPLRPAPSIHLSTTSIGTPAYVSKWLKTYAPKMEAVVEHHLRSAQTTAMRVAVRSGGLPVGG